MNALLDALNKTRWLNVTFLALAILGIVVSVFFYWRSKRERRPQFKTRSIPLIRSDAAELKSLEILYQGEHVSRLTLTRVAIWNGGRESIRASDVVARDRLRVVIATPAKLLDASLAQSSDLNNVEIFVDREKGHVVVSFDYLDFNEGLIMNVYHTGTSEATSVCGTFVGAIPLASSNDAPDYYLDRLVAASLRPVFDRAPKWLQPILALPSLLLIMTIGIPFMAADLVTRPFRRPPKGFALD